MNSLQRTIIEKAGNDNGFEYAQPQVGDSTSVSLASARHGTQVRVTLLADECYQIKFQAATPTLLPELQRSFASSNSDPVIFHAATRAELARLLKRAAGLSQALPTKRNKIFMLMLIAS